MPTIVPASGASRACASVAAAASCASAASYTCRDRSGANRATARIAPRAPAASDAWSTDPLPVSTENARPCAFTYTLIRSRSPELSLMPTMLPCVANSVTTDGARVKPTYFGILYKMTGTGLASATRRKWSSSTVAVIAAV